MKKLLFFMLLLKSSQMFTAEGDDSGKRPALPADEPAAKRQRVQEDLQFLLDRSLQLRAAGEVAAAGENDSRIAEFFKNQGLGTSESAGLNEAPAVASTPAPLAEREVLRDENSVASSELMPGKAAVVKQSKFGGRGNRASFIYLQRDSRNGNLYKCTHPGCAGRIIRLSSSDSAKRHERDHKASDLGKHPCERGCVNRFFTRNGEREIHYKSIHPNFGTSGSAGLNKAPVVASIPAPLAEKEVLSDEDSVASSELMPLQAAAAELSELDDSGKKPFKDLVKVVGDEHSYLCNHERCQGRSVTFRNRDAAVKHEKDHQAVDSKKFPCERGCVNRFFTRNSEREIHYKAMHPVQDQSVDDSLREETAPGPVKLVAGRKNPIKMAQNQEAYKKWITHDEDGVLTCGHPDCSAQFQEIAILKRHIKDHLAKDNKEFPCERGCVNKFFIRGYHREDHYKKVHGDVQSESSGEPAAKRVSIESPAAASFDDPDAVEDMQEELDLSSFVGRKVKRYKCIYENCPQHGELFSREDMVSHCQEEHGMEEKDIELDDFLIIM